MISIGFQEQTGIDLELSEEISAILESLRLKFGTVFDFWRYDSDEFESCSASKKTGADPIPDDLLSDLLHEVRHTQNAVASILQDGAMLLAVPIPNRGRFCGIATARVSSDPLRMAERFAAAVVAEHENQSEVDERDHHIRLFTEQLSSSMEETTWLRTLSRNLEYCTPGHGFEEVAASTFPALKDVLQAEAVMLIRLQDPDALPVPEQMTFPVWVGRPIFSETHCREFLASIIAGASRQPFVWNFGSGLGDSSSIEPSQEIRSCILVEIGNDSRRYGWILVLNKIPPEFVLRDAKTGEFATLGFDEFGTVEATLVESAARMLATHATNIDLFADQQSFTVSVIRSMVNVLDARDRYTCGHSERVAMMGRAIASHLGLPDSEEEQVYLSGLLHDVGKVAIPDEVLLKPGRLTDEEFDIIKKHPAQGVEILQHIKQLKPTLPGVLHHHEAWDGSGYPHGLKGEDIPLMARILAVADTFDAITTCRPYRNARSVEQAVLILREGRGKQWDPRIATLFLENLESITSGAQDWETHVSKILDPTGSAVDEMNCSLDDSVIRASAFRRTPDPVDGIPGIR